MFRASILTTIIFFFILSSLHGQTSFYVNYSVSNGDSTFVLFSVNNNFTNSNPNTFKYIIVDYDTLHDVDSNIGYLYDSTCTTVDSIFYEYGHKNNSGSNDTIVVKIITLNSKGYPTNTVLWSDTTITDSTLTGPKWTDLEVRKLFPKFVLPKGVKFGIRIEYYGPQADSFGVNAGFTENCGGKCGAMKARFYSNSYYYYNGVVSGLWPTPPGGLLFYDCDTNGMFNNNKCEAFIVQNFRLKVHLKFGDCLRLNAANDTFVCGTDSVPVSTTPSGGIPPYTFSWTPSAGLGCTTCQSPNAYPSVKTTYIVAIVDSIGNTNTDSVMVDVFSKPVVNASPDDTICEGQSVTLNATGGIFYSWLPSTGLSCTDCQSPSASPVNTLTYTVNVIDSNGCSDTASVTITVYPLPFANAGLDTTMCKGESVVLKGTGGSNFSWSPALGLSCSSCQQPVASPDSTITYILTVTDLMGCTDTDEVIITVVPPPVAHFGYSTNGLQVNFFDSSENATGYIWMFGDSSQSLLANPSHAYNTNGLSRCI